MLNLDKITLIGIDCVDANRLETAIAICERYAKFDTIKLLTSQNTDCKYTVRIPHISNIREYSKFMIKELYKYVDTEFALCIQWDGFIIQPMEWCDDYYNQDFIGAPWWFNDNRNVGNGAFSLRSKKYLDVCKDLPIKNYHPEDLVLNRIYKNLLLDKGIKFCPESLAMKFSFEGNAKVGHVWQGNTFGFHDFQQSDMHSWENFEAYTRNLKMDY